MTTTSTEGLACPFQKPQSELVDNRRSVCVVMAKRVVDGTVESCGRHVVEVVPESGDGNVCRRRRWSGVRHPDWRSHWQYRNQ